MKLVRFSSATGPRLGLLRAEAVLDLSAADAGLPTQIEALLAEGESGLRRAADASNVAPEIQNPGSWLPLFVAPQKVICVGLNYADHARETGAQPPPEPIIFNKFASALAAHEADLVLPNESAEVDYEAELVVVIGRRGRNIASGAALQHVAGYCCGNDVSARDWQLRKPGHQWLLGKSFDGFAPHGPALVTADEIANPGDLAIRCRINGAIVQDSRTSQLIFPIAELLAYVSRVCTLEPGDLLFTGTPPGVGMARKPPRFLRAGDEVEIEIEGLGTLRNRVVGENAM